MTASIAIQRQKKTKFIKRAAEGEHASMGKGAERAGDLKLKFKRKIF
jgi:hypothetical protein